nr:MAG TPA: tailspike protein [Caudoviricetes sp.]
MPIKIRAQLKRWFSRGAYPTESQFADLIDSFVHKHDKIPVDAIEGLSQTLNSKCEAAQAEQLDARQAALEGELKKYKNDTDLSLKTIIPRLADGEDLTAIEVGDTTVFRLADKQHNPATFSGKGRKYLRKNIVGSANVLTQEDFAEANTVYNIQYDYDLQGETITIPEGCTLKFEGGSISNGTLHVPSTKMQYKMVRSATNQYNYQKVYAYPVAIETPTKSAFNNIVFDGLFVTATVSYEMFGNYDNDTTLLAAMCHLALTGTTPCTLNLEPNRVYDVYAPVSADWESAFEFIKSSHKVINGNGATINDLRTRSEIGSISSGIFGFWECSDVKILDLKYVNKNEDWPLSIVSDIHTTGSTFIRLYGDCDSFDISVDVEGARYGVFNGDYNRYWWCGLHGLTNSTVKVTARRCGYPLVVEIGDNLSLWVHSELDHRSAYLMGVTNTSIYVESKDQYGAPIKCLLGDFRYSDSPELVLFRAPKNVKINYKDLGTTIVEGMDATGTPYTPDSRCFGITVFPDVDRDPLVWSDINVHIDNTFSNSIIADFSFERLDVAEGTGDVYQNIRISVASNTVSYQFPNRITMAQHCIYDNVVFAINSQTPIYVKNYSSTPVLFDSTNCQNIWNFNGSMKFFNSAVALRQSAEDAVVEAMNSEVVTGSSLSKARPILSMPVSNHLPSSVPRVGALVFSRYPEVLGLSTSSGVLAIPAYHAKISGDSTDPIRFFGAKTFRPKMESSYFGFPFFDTDLNIPIWAAGASYICADGQPADAARTGTSEQRPSGVKIGFCYFDTTLSKPIWWTGSAWVDATGAAV